MNQEAFSIYEVLILDLMEDTLGVLLKVNAMLCSVLILVLMEDTLGVT